MAAPTFAGVVWFLVLEFMASGARARGNHSPYASEGQHATGHSLQAFCTFRTSWDELWP